MKLVLSLILVFTFLFSDVIPVSKSNFLEIKNGVERMVDLRGKDYIVVSLREKGADGRFYAIDRDGDCWQTGQISSGAVGHRTPDGVFKVLWKTRYHMSSKYPDLRGVNNMDYSLFFTSVGHALHLGNINSMSHGCIHVNNGKIEGLFDWGRVGMPVIVTRQRFFHFVQREMEYYNLY